MSDFGDHQDEMVLFRTSSKTDAVTVPRRIIPRRIITPL